MNIKRYAMIDIPCGSNIEDAVGKLLEYKTKGILACVDFNGHMLYSDTVTIDDAYKEIMGCTKEEYEESQRIWRENYWKEETTFAREVVPNLAREYMVEGRKFIDSSKWKLWDKVVSIRLHDLYHGMELDGALRVMKILSNKGSLDEASHEMNKQGHSGMSYSLTLSIIKEFHDRGNEFAKYVKEDL